MCWPTTGLFRRAHTALLNKRGCPVPLVVHARAKLCFVDGEDGRMGARGLSKSWCFVDEPRGQGQQARLFAKALATSSNPAPPGRQAWARLVLLGCEWVIKASPRAASQALPAEHLHISCGRPSGPPTSTCFRAGVPLTS
jgi:hypothetical protein